jgi:sacsin
MKHWQGPALLAWNDATFSPSDFKNIAKIGQDSKVAKPNAAGRFGLGFNAVYHFTDLPSFVSGGTPRVVRPALRVFTWRERRETGFED